MLTNLLVRNIALVKEAEIDFRNGLNIMTGETGAGKSIILGAINLALGGKAGADYIGRYGDSAYVELSFQTTNPETLALLDELDIDAEDGNIIISRKLMPNKSVLKINGESTNQANVRKITETLLDIHGQHDHQSLLYRNKQLDILDRYGKAKLDGLREQCASHYKEYQLALDALREFDVTEEERNRQVGFLQFELDEITKSNLKIGEDEELEQAYRVMVNAKRITEDVARAYSMLDGENGGGASDLISHAYSYISNVADFDPKLSEILQEISNIDSLIADLNRNLCDYIESLEYDDAQFYQIESRLNQYNHLKSKYGNTLDAVLDYAEELQRKLDFFEDYENRYSIAVENKKKTFELILKDCEEIHKLRSSYAMELEKAIEEALLDLNFGQVKFHIDLTKQEEPTRNGMDCAEFMISLNPGEELKPLSKVASGGELSRIMLGIKSVLAGKDDIETLIFDEIDTGISGRTAQMVSQKMSQLATNHQLLCITHLPQIAAMADAHYLIEKQVEEGFTQTYVHELSEESMIQELSRMLGGLEINDTVRENARQMKHQANEYKKR